MSVLRASGAYVPLESVEWLPETADVDTPEFLLDAVREANAKRARDDLQANLALIPEREALAIMLSEGLFGHSPHAQAEVARYIGAASQQAVSYTVRRAKARLKYLLTRPAIDPKALGRVLSPVQLEIVREVYATASFAAVARRRCTDGLTRRHAQRVRRAFLHSLARVERAGLVEQVAALRHLLEHMGTLDYHGGKGRR